MFARLSSARKPGLRMLALAGVLVAAACAPVSTGLTGPRIDTDKPVPVALLVPSGSGQAGDEVLADSLEKAARLAISDLGGVEIDLRVYPTAGNAQQAASQAALAVDEGARIILGPVYGEAANAAGIAVRGRNINVLSFSNNTSIAGGNVFVLGPTFANTADRMAGFAAAQGRRNIVIVHGSDTAGQLARGAIQSAAARAGIAVGGTVAYDLSQQSVINTIPQIVSTVRGSGADAIFFDATTAGALPLFTQLLPEAGIRPDTTQFIGLTRWDIPPQTLELPGVQGGWFALPDPGLTSRFTSRYQAAYGTQPHPIAGLAFDGIAAIGALVAAGQADALTGAALTQGAGFQGVGGIFRLRGDGTNERGLAIATIQNRQVIVIDPAPRSFGGAGL
jgi:ABC-type branched-subunit amino acid transport system substrate-binding protein